MHGGKHMGLYQFNPVAISRCQFLMILDALVEVSKLVLHRVVLSAGQVGLLLKMGFTITAAGAGLFCALLNPLLLGSGSGRRLADPGIELFSLTLRTGPMFRRVAQRTGERETQV